MFKKGYIFISLCLLLTCFLLLGCTKTENKKEENPSDTQKENVTDDEKLSDNQKENITDNHEPSENETDNTELSDESELEDTDKNEEEVTFDLLENYKERNILSVYEQGNGEEHYSNVCLNKNKEIQYYTCSKDAEGYHIWKYTLTENEEEKSASWKREAVLWTEGIQKEILNGLITVFLGQDGNEYAWYLGEDENAHLVKQNGDSFIEIKGLDWGYTEFIEPAVLENGNIVSADLGKNCSIYNPEDGSVLKRFPCGFYQSLCVEENQIYIADPTGSSVQHYDAKKEEFASTIEAGFETTIRVAIQDEDIYVCTVTGIYRAKKEGGKFQKVLDAGTYHFAKEGGTLLKFFVIGDAFYVVYGEDGGAIKKYSPAREDDIATNSLNIYSLKKNEVILDMLSEFQDKYPDTEIIYETGEGSEGTVTVADRIRALNARILAGDGPDILVLDGLPTESYIEKGILADLNPLLGDLKEELLPSVLSAYTVEGNMYMLPTHISFAMFLTSGQEESVYSSLEALVEYSEKEEGVLPPRYSYGDYLEVLYYNYRPELISEDKTINEKNLEEFLSLTKRLCESEQAVEESTWVATYQEGRDPSFSFFEKEADLAFVFMNSPYSLDTYPYVVETRGGELVPNGEIFFPSNLLGVNRLSKKTDLTETFIQFAFSYEIQERYIGRSGGFQIHTKVLDEFAKIDHSGWTSSRSDGVTLKGAGQEKYEWLIQVVKEKLRTPFTVEETIWKIIEEESIGYLKGDRELKESVNAITSRIQLYLYEQ